MKTQNGVPQRAGRRCLCLFLLSILFGTCSAAHAACVEEALSPPTLTSVHARTVSQSNICNMAYNVILPTSDPCVNAQWFAVGFTAIPGTGSGVEVRFVYDLGDFCNEIIVSRSVLVLTVQQSYVDAHPEGFAISSEQQTPFGDGVSWEFFQEGTAPPPLSFEGAVIPDPAGYLLDVTYTGGIPAIAGINELIVLINESDLPTRQKRPLLAVLNAASEAVQAGDCQLGMNHLNTFQNKVRAQVSTDDAALAEALINGAQVIIDADCGEEN